MTLFFLFALNTYTFMKVILKEENKMRRRKEKHAFRNYMRRTYKNKIAALILLLPALLSMYLFEDGTYFLFMLLLTTPMIFSKKDLYKNWN